MPFIKRELPESINRLDDDKQKQVMDEITTAIALCIGIVLNFSKFSPFKTIQSPSKNRTH